ncbi:MAG: hypothetical protein EA380_10105 [Phycisphaeraceae bacterium]|nr:MAG: hypothetical protein EA380_10105 [Phycisphaeraceae bacterium]
MSTLTPVSPIACLTPAEGKTRVFSCPTGQRRLFLAMCAIVLMGLTDLACTIIYLTNIGLLEANPIARWVIVQTGVGGLIAYKSATMLFTCGALYAIRRHRASERCAWICATILLGLMAHWAHFNAVIPSLSHEMILIALNEHAFPIEGWVTLAQH